MRVLKLALMFMWLAVPHTIWGISCTGGDWDEMLCKLEEYPGTRCKNAEFFRLYCENATSGCEVVGGCIGTTPMGHWYPIVDNGTPRWRCRCGCFGADTVFASATPLSGREIIHRKGENIRLQSLDDWEHLTTSERDINGIMHARDGHGLKITTITGRFIVLSEAHPVVIANAIGKMEGMKQAQDIHPGEYLLNSEGESEKVVLNEMISYSDDLMNFNIVSDNATNHVVVGNGLLLGDLGWQETLSSIGSRILYRTEIMKALRSKHLPTEDGRWL